jgi:hypothetical protein
LNESLVSWFGFFGLYFICTESRFDRHKGGIILWAFQLYIDPSWSFDFKNQILAQLFSHLFLHLKILVDELIIIQGVSNERLALIAFAEANFYISWRCCIQNNINVLRNGKMEWELMIEGEVDDFSVVYANGIECIFIVVVGDLEEICFLGW